MGFREILDSWEDKWYEVWDNIDKKVPVHNIIDGIDKVFPSFYVFLVLLIALLGYIGLGLFTGIAGGTSVTLAIQDADGNPIQGIETFITIDGKTNSFTSNSVGKIILQNLKIGSEMEVSVEDNQYALYSQTFTIEAGKEYSIQLDSPSADRIIIQLVDSSGQSLSGKTMTAQFSCENSSVVPDPQVTQTSNGVLQLTPPKNCGTLVGKFFGPGYLTKEGIPITGSSPVIEFEAVEPEKGTLQVKVLDKDGTILQGMNVQVYDEYGSLEASKATNAFGLATIEDVAEGRYDVSISDPNNDFASTTISVSVEANELNTEDVTLSKDIKGTIDVLVKDKSTQAALNGAEVKLIQSSTGKILDKRYTNDQGEVTFSVQESGSVDVVALATGYLANSQEDVDVSGDEAIVLSLEKLTPQNSGRVEAKVLDESGTPVENAKVSIYNSKTGFLLNTINPSTTDVNGTAKFVGVPAGSYFLRAYKFPNSPSDSQAQTTKIEELSTFNIKLAIGNSTLKVKVIDKDGNPIPQATVEFLSEGSAECGKNECVLQTGLEGTVEKTFKSDRKIYALVSASGYISFVTASAQLYPNKTIELTANMEKTLLGNSPQIEFAGVYEKAGGLAKELKAGRSYIAKFKLKFPISGTFEEGGSIIRTGIESIMENDALYFTSVNAPTASIFKFTTFNPPIGNAIDDSSLTEGDFKWAKIFYPNTLAGIYNIELEVRVRDETVIGKKLAFNYNIFGLSSDGKVKRAPIDAALGEAKTSPNKHEWYAESYEKIYFEGTPELCDELFCYSGEKVFDQAAQLLVAGPPYEVLINRNFDISFLVSNNSAKIYPNAQIQILSTENGTTASDNMLISAYSIKTVDGELIEGKNLSVNRIPDVTGSGIPLGSMNQFKTVQGKITVQPKQSGPIFLKLNLTDNGKVIFSKSIEVDVISENTLTLQVSPPEAGAFSPTTFKVKAIDEQGAEVQGALATLVKITPDKIRVLLDQKLTNSVGEVTFDAPASSPNTKLVFDAAKEGFTTIPVTIVVDTNLVKFDPKTADFSLNAIAGDTEIQTFTLTNKTQNELKIVKAEINVVNSNGLLEIGKMQNFIQQYENTVIVPATGNRDIDIEAALSNLISIKKSANITGSIMFTFRSDDLSREWVQVLPLNVKIGIVGNCDAGGVQLSGVGNNGKWETSIFESQIQEEFTISNTCEFENSPTPLSNLKAKLTWTGDPVGTVQLTIVDIEAGTSFTEVLRHGAYIDFYDKFKPVDQGPYQAVITFIPLTGNLGKTAEFDIEIGAEAGTKTLSQKFSSKLLITNLNSCLTLDPVPEKGVTMKADEDSAEFSIDSTKCGDVPIDIEFCNEPNNHNCSGGTAEGDIFLDQFSINNMNNEKKTITVERKSSTLPGNYGITIQARTPGTSFRQVAVMDVTVEPSPVDHAFTLDKYEFLLPQKGSKDATTLTNSLLMEQIAVRAGVCDWDKAMRNDKYANATKYAVVAGAAAGIGEAIAIYAGVAIVGGPIGAVVIVVAVVIAAIIYALAADPCDDHDTHPLQDYIMNLSGVQDNSIPADAQQIFMSDKAGAFVSALWDIKVTNIKIIDKKGYQEVGAVFENLTGFTDPNPVYGVAEFHATEHIHGDPLHVGQAKTNCHDSHFGTFNVNSPHCDETKKDHIEKFHLKFKTQDTNYSLPNLAFDAVACTDGSVLGATGAGALPKIALNWEWDNTTGITENSCDAKNPNSIYCDATQFNIMVMKRVQKFREFLELNGNNFSCPLNNNSKVEEDQLEFINNALVVDNGKLGLEFISRKFVTPTTVQFTMTVKNSTSSTQNAIVNVSISNPDEVNSPSIPAACTKEGQITANGELNFDCVFDKLSISDYYSAEIIVSSDTTSSISETSGAIVNFSTKAEAENIGKGACSTPKTTAYVLNNPGINYWIDSSDPTYGKLITAHPTYTSSVPNVQALTELLHFDALLEKDGFTSDFENDFRDYYTKNSFASTPSWFFDQTNGSTFSKYYGKDNHMTFLRKYTNENQLLAPGKYRVDIEVYFTDDWAFFDANNQPKAIITVVFQNLEEPSPNFAFYSLPFDGLVGSVGSSLDRVGYGTGFTNLDQPISVDNAAVKTFTSTNSSPLVNVQTDIATDLRRLNALPATRGSLLTIEPSSDGLGKKLIFSPSLATPVLMKVHHAVTNEPFSAAYTPLVDNVPVDTGNNFTFWDGAGNCYDFTGVPVYEKFNFTSDRSATPADQINSWENAYAVDWEKSLATGDTYLRTIIYSDPKVNTAVKSEKDYVSFLTPANNSFTDTAQINGIANMQYNNFSAQIDSMRDVLDLVKSKQICLDNSGLKTRFFWNPQTIYNQVDQTSVHNRTQILVAGQSCLDRAG